MSVHDPSRWAPANYIYRQFFAAVKSGVTDDVKPCLRRQDMDVNLLNGKAKDLFGETALHMAATRGDVKMIELLLAEGAHIDELDSNTDGGSTPLHNAAWAAHVDSIQVLIDSGADVNAWSATYGTPLHEVLWSASAVRPEHREAINVLAQNGADLFAEHRSTREPILFQAAKLGDIRLLQCLLDAGFDVNHHSSWYQTYSALSLAVSHNRLAAVRFLIGSGTLVDNAVLEAVNTIEILNLVRSHVDEATLHRSGALHQACVKSKMDLVSYMLSIGMDVNTVNTYGLTPLLCVVEHEARFNIISFLLSNGADVSLKSTGGSGPLGHCLAARMSDAAVVDLLLKASSNVNITNDFQQTPLASFAGEIGSPPWQSYSVDGKISHYRLETLGMLISAGADVNAQDDRGKTPFHESLLCTMGDSALPLKIAAAKVLLEAGARIDSSDSDCRTASDLILADDHAALKILLA